ncbi:MAG: lysine-2,3-aminomutase-like protein [Hyphomicrobiaceae bacterium]
MIKSQDAKGTIKTVEELIDRGFVKPDTKDTLELVSSRYSVAITPAIADLIDPTDPADPIALQFVPQARETHHQPSENADPISDEKMTKTPGLVHRYRDRVLLKLVDICPVYCRFCFRREMVGPKPDQHPQGQLSEADLMSAMSYISNHKDVWEVIITGGDPFVLAPRRIQDVVERINAIDHVKVVRWHTRVPCVAPNLITEQLIDALKSSNKTNYVALHANHVRELTDGAREACQCLIDRGIPMVSQTVLLRGINDNSTTLAELMRAFVETGIKPYYLHHADLAPGTSHFRTTIAEGQAIMQELRETLSGLAQPTYVLDVPGGSGKVPAHAAHVEAKPNNPNSYGIKDAKGGQHEYNDCCVPAKSA